MESSENGQPLMDIVLQFLNEDQWNYQKIENKPVIRAGYRGEHGTWVCYARVDEDHQRFVFHSVMGMNIAPQYRQSVTTYLMRVNTMMPVGSFEMDLDTGELRCKTSLEVPEGGLTVGIVRSLAYTSVRAMDHYAPGVFAVVHGGLSPEAALARIEAQTIAI